jgi:hypothetical protein
MVPHSPLLVGEGSGVRSASRKKFAVRANPRIARRHRAHRETQTAAQARESTQHQVERECATNCSTPISPHRVGEGQGVTSIRRARARQSRASRDIPSRAPRESMRFPISRIRSLCPHFCLHGTNAVSLPSARTERSGTGTLRRTFPTMSSIQSNPERTNAVSFPSARTERTPFRSPPHVRNDRRFAPLRAYGTFRHGNVAANVPYNVVNSIKSGNSLRIISRNFTNVRCKRDFTVPCGMFSVCATSASGNSKK